MEWTLLGDLYRLADQLPEGLTLASLEPLTTGQNDVLHARPATHTAQGQRLIRAEVADRQTTGTRFWIDDAWFDDAIGEVNRGLSAVNAARPLL